MTKGYIVSIKQSASFIVQAELEATKQGVTFQPSRPTYYLPTEEDIEDHREGFRIGWISKERAQIAFEHFLEKFDPEDRTTFLARSYIEIVEIEYSQQLGSFYDKKLPLDIPEEFLATPPIVANVKEVLEQERQLEDLLIQAKYEDGTPIRVKHENGVFLFEPKFPLTKLNFDLLAEKEADAGHVIANSKKESECSCCGGTTMRWFECKITDVHNPKPYWIKIYVSSIDEVFRTCQSTGSQVFEIVDKETQEVLWIFGQQLKMEGSFLE